MTYEKTCLMMDALALHINGATAIQVAADLNLPPSRVSGALGKLAMYGVIQREARAKPHWRGGTREYHYRVHA